MKTVEYMGLKFVDDVYFQNQMESDVDSYLYSIMHHYELNGLVEKYHEREILTFEFKHYKDGYHCKEFNKLSWILGFTLAIKSKKIESGEHRFEIQQINTTDFNVDFKLSFTTIDSAIKFCNMLINYEIINFLDKSERLFK